MPNLFLPRDPLPGKLAITPPPPPSYVRFFWAGRCSTPVEYRWTIQHFWLHLGDWHCYSTVYQGAVTLCLDFYNMSSVSLHNYGTTILPFYTLISLCLIPLFIYCFLCCFSWNSWGFFFGLSSCACLFAFRPSPSVISKILNGLRV